MHNLRHEHLAVLESHYGSLDLWLHDHGKSPAYKRYRDSQRRKVYNSEAQVFWLGNRGIQFANLDEVRHYINKLVATDWWKARYPHVTKVTIKSTRARHAWARRVQNVIGMPSVEFFLTEKTVLHELAHLVVKTPHPGHGPLYCRVYLDLITLMMGGERSAKLEQQFQQHKVRYTAYPIKAAKAAHQTKANQTPSVYAGGKGHRVRISAGLYSRLYNCTAGWRGEGEEITFSGDPKRWDTDLTIAFCLLHPITNNKSYTTIEVHSKKELDKLEDWMGRSYIPSAIISAACGRLIDAIHKYSSSLSPHLT